jgi:hypothetical protein
MIGRLDIEQLMVDALDGTLDARGQARLEKYLAQHASERAVFEQMQRVDGVLRSEPIIPAPVELKSRVMLALPHPAAVHPTPAHGAAHSTTHRAAVAPGARAPHMGLTVPQAVFIGVVGTMVLAVMVFTLLAVLPVSPDALSQAAPPATAAIWRATLNLIESMWGVLITLLRALLSQPITWAIACASFVVASLWARLILILLLPTLRLVLT